MIIMQNKFFNPTNDSVNLCISEDDENNFLFGKASYSVLTHVKSLFIHKQYDSSKIIFLDEVKSLSKKYGLGDVSFNIEYDEAGYPEKIIAIKVPEYKSVEDANDAHFKIIDEMETFSKENQLFNFFMDSYIVLDY